MSNYFDVIRRNAEVIAETSSPFPGIFYMDGESGFASFETPTGIAEFSCENMADFNLLCETVTEDDGEYEDDFLDEPDDLECGFDPYEGCYTFDC